MATKKRQDTLDRDAVLAPVRVIKNSHDRYIAVPPNMEEGEVGYPLLLHLVKEKQIVLSGRKIGLHGVRIARLAEYMPLLVATREEDGPIVAAELAVLKGRQPNAFNEMRAFCGGGTWGYWGERYVSAYQTVPTEAADAMSIRFLLAVPTVDVTYRVLDTPTGVVHWSTHGHDSSTKLLTMRTNISGELDATLQ